MSDNTQPDAWCLRNLNSWGMRVWRVSVGQLSHMLTPAALFLAFLIISSSTVNHEMVATASLKRLAKRQSKSFKIYIHLYTIMYHNHPQSTLIYINLPIHTVHTNLDILWHAPFAPEHQSHGPVKRAMSWRWARKADQVRSRGPTHPLPALHNMCLQNLSECLPNSEFVLWCFKIQTPCPVLSWVWCMHIDHFLGNLLENWPIQHEDILI